MLLPAAPQDWLPAGHLARFINDTVDALDLKAFYARYEGGGSRKIERRLHEGAVDGRRAQLDQPHLAGEPDLALSLRRMAALSAG